MKTLVASLLLAGTLVTGSLASAQNVVNLPAEDTPIVATFFDGNPADGGELIEDGLWGAIEVELDDSAIGEQIDDIEEADYLVLTVGDTSLTFDTTGGSSKNSIHLVYDGEALDDASSLAEVVDDITAALEGEADLAVFTDADGVVTGFYNYTDANLPTVDLSEADQVLVSFDGQLETYQTATSGVRSLESVSVIDSAGETVVLGSLLS